jgi:hypothetical protein
MSAALIVATQALCCLGLGAAILRALGLLRSLHDVERVAWSFALGTGVLGWSVFFVGAADVLRPTVLSLIFGMGLTGCAFLRIATQDKFVRFDGWQIFCLLVLAVAAVFDLLEAISPPADADSLAYHFALPKQFIAAGGLEFVPRAVDGAIPLLIHMTYVPVLALGGEQALTLWTMVSGWGTILLAYAVSHRFLGRTGGLVVAILLATTPAIVYSGGAGHVEARLAMFALLAAIAISDTARTGDWRFAAVAGLAVGFVLGGKYSGLLFAPAAGFALISSLGCQRRPWFASCVVMTLVALVAGGQWYVWNWIHTGDPVFPVLFGILNYSDPAIWDTGHQRALAQAVAMDERAAPINFLWWIAYPFVATLNGLPIFESGRTGFGPFVLLVFPIAMLATLANRGKIQRNPLFAFAIIALLFYTFWFLSGFSQRIRHLLLVYPILLIGVSVAAARYADRVGVRAPLFAAVGLSVIVQLGGHLIFTRNYAQYILTDETRDQFLARNVPGYPAAAWINENLPRDAKVFTMERQLVYHFKVPVYYGHPADDALVDIRTDAKDPLGFLSRLRHQGVTHLLVLEDGARTESGIGQWKALAAVGCLQTVNTFDIAVFQSRTLPSLALETGKMRLLQLDARACNAMLAKT